MGRKLALAALLLGLAVPAGAQAAVLHDQTDHLGFYSNPSDDYDSGQDVLDNQSADDFTVPPGELWQLSSADLIGSDAGATSRLVNVWIYGTAGTLPGAQLFQGSVTASNYPNYSVPISGAPTLGPGTYWISVQQTHAFYSTVTWAWQTRTIQDGNPAVFRNPGGGYVSGSCLDWTPQQTCFPSGDNELAWSISGSAVSQKVTFGRLERLADGTARLTVNLPGNGILTVGGKGVRGASDLVGAAKSVTVRIKATGRARRSLNANGKVTVKPYFGFSAPGADPSKTNRKIKLTKRS